MIVEWVEGAFTVAVRSSERYSTRQGWIGNGLFGVHVVVNGVGGLRFRVTHIPTGFSMIRAAGDHVSIDDAKEAAAILLAVQDDWHFTAADIAADEDLKASIGERCRAAIRDRFGGAPFDGVDFEREETDIRDEYINGFTVRQ